jgi:hypothetical protein
MREDMEDILANMVGALGIYRHNSFLLSNLGDILDTGGWVITEINFTSAMMKASIGNAGLAIKVGVVDDDAHVLSLSFEAGVVQ